MRNLNDKIERYKCNWLKDYLKELIKDRDLKTYNRVKCVMYYFPDVFKNVTMDDLKIAMKHSDDTYICLGSEDTRYTVFDKIYKEKNNKEFEPPLWGECRYITIDEFCKYFAV